MWTHIVGSTVTGCQSSNAGEWTKKPESWNRLKLKIGDLDHFGSNLMQEETNDEGSYLNEAQQQRIQDAESIEPNYWFKLANWAKTRDLLTLMERKAAFNFGTMASRGRKMKSLKQALFALKIVEEAKDKGFEG